MTKPALHTNRKGSRLSNYLSSLGVSQHKPSQQNFAERVGELIGLPGSLVLSSAPLKVKPQPAASSDQGIQDLFLEQHNQLVQFIAACFDGSETRRRFQLPSIHQDTEKPLTDLKRFYINVQTELAGQVYKLHILIKDAAADISPHLKQLCTLDSAMSDILSNHIKRSFSSIPNHLDQRFQYWQQHSDDNFESAISNFCQELQQLLLAELDARLQTTYGLIEAVNEQVSTSND
ncbi:DUF3348 domain-containing protein [Dasania sp. GY-MA-18]|uniref:DUF3348 domain-containing protein n=1 Tax=Dasania phycosphaerae TaxID=2950436 RepID=A0A9J6RIM8_9GAMM|nr:MULTISPECIES: DUF3348 domain-containing protein [Dasania]MCR8921627.1 DUF3348 domain-containing protein [Dasania sp. GY-MA-18]MCZ0864055.1 DUF3348 domain-containing protein [Dasania phycosphaerae]MCZ0867783.1 DUF3348 domain-containing protein [Dasania phycosphaerae]